MLFVIIFVRRGVLVICIQSLVNHMLVKNLIMYVIKPDSEYITVSQWLVYQRLEQLTINEVFSIFNKMYIS
jgi:hypothetical protein